MNEYSFFDPLDHKILVFRDDIFRRIVATSLFIFANVNDDMGL